MDLGLSKRTAIITGASRGIGLAIATALAREGCRLVLCARNADTLQSVAEDFRSSGTEVEALPLDICEPDAGVRLVASALDRFGSVDIFVGNAGGNSRNNFEDTTDEDWKGIFELNVLAHARCSRAVIAPMRKTGQGSIVFIASIFGREAGGPGLSIYNATKSALISMAKIMALELAPDQIRVNTVAPGSIRFPGGSWDRRCTEDPAGMSRFVEENLPMGRFGKANEVADVVAFLSSPRASWISGACINVDGVQSKSLI